MKTSRKLSGEALHNLFIQYAKPTMDSEKVKSMEQYFQHGETSCLSHSIAVALISLKIVHHLGLKCDKQSLIRGALLHDYFLYDWHKSDKPFRFHGLTHPKTALKNASTDFDLTHIEKDIIKKHMFPLTLTPPKHRESLIVCLADKICAVYEVFSKNPYKSLPVYS